MRLHIIAAAVLAALVGACSQTTRVSAPAPSVDPPAASSAPRLALAAPQPAKITKITPRRSVDPAERDCLAEAIYFESRGEPRDSQVAVAHVVLNRVASKNYPSRVCSVIREGEELGKGRCQFHWRCDGRSDVPSEYAAWQDAQALAEDVLAGTVPDPTKGAQFFHATYVTPQWASRLRPTARIGAHIYYAQ